MTYLDTTAHAPAQIGARLGNVFELLADRIEAERVAAGIVGMSVAVVADGGVAWSQGFGAADIERGIAAGPDTKYRIASITKTFTATALMLMRAQGRMQLDDPIDRYVPELRTRTRAGDARSITFRQALSHSAGLPKELPPDDEWWGFTDDDVVRMLPVASLLKRLPGIELVVEPGTVFHYSNVGFALTALAIERVTGIPIGDLLRTEICVPLGMDATAAWSPEVNDELAIGYRFDLDHVRRVAPRVDPGSNAGAGGLTSTVEDLAKFALLHLGGSPSPLAATLGPALTEMRQPMLVGDTQVAVGWWPGEVDGHTMVEHSGNLPGCETSLAIVPDLGLGLIACANTNAGIGGLTSWALRLLVVAASDAAVRVHGGAARTASWDRFVGRYVDPQHSLDVASVDGELCAFVSGAADERLRLCPQEEDGVFEVLNGHYTGERAVFLLDATGVPTELRLENWRYRRLA